MNDQHLLNSIKAQVLDIAIGMDKGDCTDLDLVWNKGEELPRVVRQRYTPIETGTGLPDQIIISGDGNTVNVREAATKLFARYFPKETKEG